MKNKTRVLSVVLTALAICLIIAAFFIGSQRSSIKNNTSLDYSDAMQAID